MALWGLFGVFGELLGSLCGALGITLGSFGGLFGVFGELLGSLCGALGVTSRSFGDLGGYRACPKGGEAPVGQGRLGNTCDISVVAGDILGYPLWGPEGGGQPKCRQTDRSTPQTERQTERQTDRQTDRVADKFPMCFPFHC